MKIIVVGNNVKALSIASECSGAGHEVIYCGTYKKSFESVLDRMMCVMDRIGIPYTNHLKSLHFVDRMSDGLTADLILDAMEAPIEEKKRHYESIEKYFDETIMIAPCLSTVSVECIASLIVKPERVLGLYYFCPAWLAKAVEVIPGIRTSDFYRRKAEEFVESVGKKTLESKDYPGYTTNRVVIPQWNEAIQIVMEGNRPEDIDLAMREVTKTPMGPLQFADFIGLDSVLHIMNYLYDSYKDVKFRPSPLLVKMVESGNIGVQSGKGFYTYR